MPLKNGQLSEAEEQALLMRWAEYIPELKWLFAIPNGGSRHRLEAINLKRQGVKKGVSDLCLPLPRGGYNGLYIEMKVGRNKPSEEQKEFLRYVVSNGYCGVVCYGFDEAQKVITKYLKGEGLEAEMAVSLS